MKFPRATDSRESANDEIGEQASDWLVRLIDEDVDSQEPYASPIARNHAFMHWVGQSPEHLRIFLETVEMHRRLRGIDATGEVRITDLLANRDADVIRLYTGASEPVLAVAPSSSDRPQARRVRWLGAASIAASVAVVAVAAFLWRGYGVQTYSTGVGEQHTAKLDDGSFVTLNTNTIIEADFSEHTRNIRLIRGEALFVVAHDSTRPFWVRAGDAAVRAVGTEFDVRRRAESTDVSVVEGVVQVTTLDAPAWADSTAKVAAQTTASLTTQAPLRLAAGEEAKVSSGRVIKSAHPSVENSLSWRQRRLKFLNAPLWEIADELNRYNKVQVIVEGAAREKKFSGVFDADHPEILALYAAKDDSLAVAPEENRWVIRSR